MAKEDEALPVKMGSLEIESIKITNTRNTNANILSFAQEKGKSLFSRKFMTNKSDCSCISTRIIKNVAICKKKQNQSILKEPVLKLLQNYNGRNNKHNEPHIFVSNGESVLKVSSRVNEDIASVCALVDNCNQLRISTGARDLASRCSNDSHWWKKNIPISRKLMVPPQEKSHAGPSCSQQALNPPCDVTIDELASYFETLVHIPKKMSSMAEMMYI